MESELGELCLSGPTSKIDEVNDKGDISGPFRREMRGSRPFSDWLEEETIPRVGEHPIFGAVCVALICFAVLGLYACGSKYTIVIQL
jgi:hypothetical protein